VDCGRPSADACPKPLLLGGRAPAGLAEESGVLLVEVPKGYEAAATAFRGGDVIVHVGGGKVPRCGISSTCWLRLPRRPWRSWSTAGRSESAVKLPAKK
jgi:hypothetical protein